MKHWSHTLLALIVLTANVVAPFQSSDSGRTPLGSLPHPATNRARSVVRVRALGSTAVHGYRAVVGITRRGADLRVWASNVFAPWSPSLLHVAPPDVPPAPALRNSPLRC